MMRNVLGIAFVAVLACACGRGDDKTDQNANPAATDTAQSAPAATGTSGTNDTIVLTGCLQRGNANQAVGTSGSKTTARPDATAAPATPADNADFILVHATAGAPDASGQPTGTSGVGSNGAGASGGPLVTGTDSYVLEGNDLTEHEHQLVRVTGRFPDPLAGGVLSGRAAPSSEPSTPPPNANPTPNAAARAKGNANANDVGHMRHVQVESVTMVAANCSAK